jgi:NAD(P)-dependent dehydrogenase (short-subunit alcohol dehydrogenase family)
MKPWENKVAVVTGGSRWLGRAIARELSAGGARVISISRRPAPEEDPAIQAILGDATDPALAERVLADYKPDVLVLSAGVAPKMAPLEEHTWESFSAAWEADVKHTFFWAQRALTQPLAPGSAVLIVSSGAAIGGSPLSGGYAGAKRMQWFLSGYLQQQSDARRLGIRFLALAPRAIMGDTELGHSAAAGYAARRGISKEQFLDSLGPRLTAAAAGRAAAEILSGAAGAGRVYGVTGGGVSVLEK